MEMNLVLVVLGFAALGILVAVNLKKIKSEETVEKLPFQMKTYFFTRSEQQFFRILEELIDHSKFTIFPKVRLGDFVKVSSSKEEWRKNWNKIRAKHVDFLIWDKQKNIIVVAIELDGKSHSSEKMMKSDTFKNKLYPSIGLELVRVRVGTDFESEIRTILQRLK